MIFMKKIHSCPQGSQSPWSSSHWNSVVKLKINQISTSLVVVFVSVGLFWDWILEAIPLLWPSFAGCILSHEVQPLPVHLLPLP